MDGPSDKAFAFDLGKEKHAEIDGLLGWDVLQQGCWQWDAFRNQLTLRPSIPEESVVHELIGWDHMPVIEAETNGRRLRWGFDSGNTETTGGRLLLSSLAGFSCPVIGKR